MVHPLEKRNLIYPPPSEGLIEVVEILEYTSIQKLEAQFWVEFMNKVKLQLFARILALPDMKDVIVSAMVVNIELIDARLIENHSQPHDVHNQLARRS